MIGETKSNFFDVKCYFGGFGKEELVGLIFSLININNSTLSIKKRKKVIFWNVYKY